MFLPEGASSEERDSVSYASVTNRGDDGRERAPEDAIGRYEAIFGRPSDGQPDGAGATAKEQERKQGDNANY